MAATQQHLSDNTELRAHGFVADSGLVAEVHWDFPIAGSRLAGGSLWGTPEAMRRLAELATQAAIQAEEEAAWQAHQATTTTAAQGCPRTPSHVVWRTASRVGRCRASWLVRLS